MKLKNIIVALLIGASLHSCDYLDIVPDDTPILADAFKNEQTAENFVFACYSFIPNYLNFRQNFSWCTTPETVGSAHWTTTWLFLKSQNIPSDKPETVVQIVPLSFIAI